MAGRTYSQPVYSKVGPDGFRQQIFVMYHATNSKNVASILEHGFKSSKGGMLGPGLYLSRDIDKTCYYGNVCFKALVYTGKTKKMNTKDVNGSWRQNYDSAYLPPNNNVVPSKREETCLKSAKNIRILGVAYGYSCLNGHLPVRNLEGTSEQLDNTENTTLQMMIKDLDLTGMRKWCYLRVSNGLVLDIAYGAPGGRVTLYQLHGGDHQLWKFEDGFLVSKRGLVADISGVCNAKPDVIGSDPHGRINQKWIKEGDFIKNQMTGLVMEVKDGKMESGTEIIMSTKKGGSNQMFFIMPEN